MNRIGRRGIIAGAWLWGATAAWAAGPSWKPAGGGIPESKLLRAASDPRDSRRLYAASKRTLYASADGGRRWQAQFRAPMGAQITAIGLEPFDRQGVWLGTTHGLYRTTDGGRHWGRVFGGAGLGSSACDSLLFHPTRAGEVFVGTPGGMWRSRDGGGLWQRLEGGPGSGSILAMAIHPDEPDRLYAMTPRELLLVSLTDERQRALFHLGSTPEPASTAEEPPENPVEETASSARLTALAVDPHAPERLFLGSSAGLYLSDDAGATWRRASHAGLGSSQIAQMALHAQPSTVAYVATPSGVGRYFPAEVRWEALTAGLPTSAVSFLDAAPHKVFAATDQGLYALDLTEEQLAHGDWPEAGEVLANFVHEPTFEQVRRTAITYADVDPNKILWWRRQARWRAIVPKFTLSANTNLAGFRHWDTGANPDALQRGERDIDWGANMNWELADLIWSSDQPAIDVRSRLMVELRDDILNDVTRTFFERRRLQIELMADPPADPKVRLDKELRIQELTAMLDSLTGGWFSRELQRASTS